MYNTKVILLGTGTPRMDQNRYMSALAIVVNDNVYIVDCGSGILERLSASRAKGHSELKNENLKHLFLTHFHPDHTLGLPGFIISPWNMGRNDTLNIFGPTGTKNMVNHILEAFKLGINEHLNHGPKQLNPIDLNIKEFASGIIFKDDLVKVEAIQVEHGTFDAYAFKFTTPDKTIVISGDTTPVDKLYVAAKDCDILVHEVFSDIGLKSRPKMYQDYMKSVHTSASDLGKAAAKVNPGKLVLTHQLLFNQTEEDLLNEIREHYKGPLYYGNDLDVFE